MTTADILKQVNDIMRDLLDDDDIVMTSDTTSADVDGWDSVLHISLVIAIEQRFKVKFQTAELEELKNVGQLVHLIAAKKGLA